jgi:hypothetical protein
VRSDIREERLVMPSALRSHLTYANVVATLALVFAMSGGALAASHYLITSTKQISPKVLKLLKGKDGETGAKGAAGPAGPAGPAGKEGAAGKSERDEKGERGEKGEQGTPGTTGKSVTSVDVKVGETECEKLGGSEFTVGDSKTYACNGREGSPWTVGGTLPPGQMETGVWNVPKSAEGPTYALMSFPIPLTTTLAGESKIHFINEKGEEVHLAGNGPSIECKGTYKAPTAEPGNLCIYETETIKLAPLFPFITFDPESGGIEEVGTTGAFLFVEVGAGGGEGYGTWAVRESS